MREPAAGYLASLELWRGAAPVGFTRPAPRNYTQHMYDHVDSTAQRSAEGGVDACLEDQLASYGLQSIWQVVRGSGLRVKRYQR